MTLRSVVILVLTFHLLTADVAFAQPTANSFEIGGQIATTSLRQFDGSDLGGGGRVGWRPARTIGVEAEVNIYPGDFPDRFAFTRARVEGLFGVTAGPTFGRLSVFGRLRPGFVVFREAPEAIACIAIYPPPLSCTLAAGDTLFATDLGGGVEVAATRKAFVRVDAGDRIIKYPGPSFDANGMVRTDPFISHDFRVTAGAGLRF
jgi:hypothetical protein